MELPFKPASTISHYAKNVASDDEDGWIYIRKDDEIALDTTCYLQNWDGRDLSPEEQDHLADRISVSGFRSFLLWSQLNDIVENLRLQKSTYTNDDLERAITFYWERDAFIDFQSID